MATSKGIILILQRTFSSTPLCYSKKNFRKFMLHNRGTKAFKEKMKTNPPPDLPPPYKYGVRDTGYKVDNRFIEVPEMIPEIIVPDLTDFKLKPYVSYRAEDFKQPEFTAQDLFIAVYRDKIANDFKDGKLNEDGSPMEPTPEELLTPDEAKLKARQTGSDIYQERSPREMYDYGLRY
uniref:39S ribosomal protein L41, mitochondrial n=1 Tax=Graphocephala atropunctata TaxID=36148 RepID=A0A1B6KJP9_9HEMI